VSLCVLFREGAVSPRELLISLEPYYPLVFAVGDDPYTRALVPLLASEGTVVELTGDPAADAARLAASGVTGIVTFSQGALRDCAELTGRLGLPGHDIAAARALTDKHLQRCLLKTAGADDVASRLVATTSDWDAAVRQIGLPLVVKPRIGERSRNTCAVRDAADGRALVARLLDQATPGHEQALVAEEYLIGLPMHPYGDYVSVDSASFEGQTRHIGVIGKFPIAPPFREVGHLYPAPLAPDMLDQVLALAGAALRALGVRHGITQTEIKLTAAGPRIIEVNGRLGGFTPDLYQRSQGFDLIQVAADLALGRRRLPVARPGGPARFAYTTRSTLDARSLTAVSGRLALLAHPMIDSYHLYVKLGTPLSTDSTYLDCVVGSAPSLAQLMRDIDECLALLTYEFETPGGRTVINGADLRAAISPPRPEPDAA
jgi:hypothetical protein